MSYTKYHSAWSAVDFLSGAAFNHIETQYDAAKADADLHTHDSRYYTKATADVTFFSTSYYTGFDADKLDGNHYADLLSSVMPIGAIMVWSGTDATIPANWHICDGGTYGGYVTPDLRDRFVIGAGNTYAVGATGGPASWNGTITPTGTVTVGDHILATTEIPAHTHGVYDSQNSGWGAFSSLYSGDTPTSVRNFGTTLQNQTSGDGAHGHTGSTLSATGIDPRPPYYSLYYIMKYA